MKNQLVSMLQLQDAMNTKVHAQWREQGYAWYRAIWVECGELLDHYGWKWWKKQNPDIDQVKLELVDIWHFGLSDLMMKSRAESPQALEALAESVELQLHVTAGDTDFRIELERFAGAVLQNGAFDVAGFGRLMHGVDLSFDELHRHYVGKNVLNFFRQDHGYKTGEYQKVWDGREDNEHLVEVLSEVSSDAPDFADKVYEGLKARYPL
ncbi:dUTP diphosphatase [Marinibactrum halimedae]|uniref:dUTPase n=1 Tax=Marinibactrum halimedae TaxID=1444977 RepID=A0AA37WNV9_9GAMM|nr:dUTP diphosphatase [Marinibactrum halimedae]MCD9460095.1 dUTP diphosphatase [Marinibactrum halimedae]GLS26496.1 dUTPase [Marinibactrum halimedae]